MRFTDLQMGEEFELDGESYRKIGPLMATSLTSGKQQLVRRSSTVTPLGDRPQAAKGGQTITTTAFKTALENYHAEIERLVDALTQPSNSEQLMSQLSALKDDLYRELGID
ncbi:MAG: hypothetical protein C0631_09280 [Sedimenticola sp.]|jgi:hypothetical protein|nr:MAG: hypothetical protein C0631_09280 [Sedimenticola sp.]